MAFDGHPHYPHQTMPPRALRGVLLVNLGTPEAPTPSALRRYLREFLSDPRVIEVPRWVWWWVLNLFILPFRPARSAKLYRSIWTEQGSPLMSISRAQTEALQRALADGGESDCVVKLGMRYGQPSIAEAIGEFQAERIDDLLVLPLYPQYASATTGSTFDALGSALQRARWVPSLHFINRYHSEPLYIQALADTYRSHCHHHGEPERLILSYHGTPERYRDAGDPYYCYCLQTSRLLREALDLPLERVQTTFQSRFGREPWLQPYTDVTLEALPPRGIRHVAVMCPGFSADCLETLEEIAEEGRDSFIQAGGTHYHYIPALNDTPAHIELLAQLVKRQYPPVSTPTTDRQEYEVSPP